MARGQGRLDTMMTTLRPSYPLYLANEAKSPNQDLPVTDKFSGEPFGRGHGRTGAAPVDDGDQ